MRQPKPDDADVTRHKTDVPLSQLYDTRRFGSLGAAVICTVYLPIGLILAMLRIAVVFGLGSYARHCSHRRARRIFHLCLVISGLRIRYDGHQNYTHARGAPCFAVANHVCLYDQIALASLDGLAMLAADPKGNRSSVNEAVFRFFAEAFDHDIRLIDDRRDLVRMLRDWRKEGAEAPTLGFAPEGTIGSGRALFRFEGALLRADVPVIPIAMRVKPALPFALHPLAAHHAMNFLWPLMTPFLSYQLSILPAMERRAGETAQEFANRVQLSVATALNVPATGYTRADKVAARARIARPRHPRPSAEFHHR